MVSAKEGPSGIGRLGDAAFVTNTGGIVARLGVRWIAGVEPCSRRAAWSPPLQQSIDLVRRVLDRLATTGEPLSFIPVLDPGERMERWRERYRVARRRDVLAGLPLEEVNAREDARFEAERRRVSVLAGVALSIGLVARMGGASSWATWLLAVTLTSIPLVGVIWFPMGFQAPARERRRRRDERLRRQRQRRSRQRQGTEPVSTPVETPASQPEELPRRERLVLAALLLLAFAGSSGVSWGLFQESGGVGAVGRIGEATVGECSGFRTRRCEAWLRDRRGVPISGQVWLHTFGREFDRGEVVRVRYRSGDAVPDTLLSRAASVVFFALFLLVAAWTLWGIPVVLFGLKGRISDFLGIAFAWTAATTVVVGVLLWFVT